VDACKALDHVDGYGKGAAREWLFVERREGMVWTFDREQRGDYINRVMREGRRHHHGPVSKAFALRVENRGEDHEIEKIRHISELHEIVQHRPRKACQPNGWVHSHKVVIEADEPAVKPTGVDDMNQPSQLFEEKDVKRKRIPMAREAQCTMGGARCRMAQPGDAEGHGDMDCEVAGGMRDVSMKDDDDCVEPNNIGKRYPFERARGPRNVFEPSEQ
jgi:hypothetical protein